MKRVAFVVPKHPFAIEKGDTRITRLLMEAAATAYEVRGVALWSEPAVRAPFPIACVPKADVRLAKLARAALRRRRSLLHQRFNSKALVDAVRDVDADVLLAEHTYMAEAALDAGDGPGGRPVIINTHVLESAVLRQRESSLGPLLKLEARRTWRDELRCVRAAASTACLGADDADALDRAGIRNVRRLDLALPPAPRAVEGGSRIALFVGDRTWAPNRHALERAYRVWEDVHPRANRASLVVVGRRAPREMPPMNGSTHVAGFVEDLEPIWSSARVLLAPVPIGGGVRVKILEAAARGLPVVASAEALGAIADYLPITPLPEEGMAQAVSELLMDDAKFRRTSAEIYDANRELWSTKFVERQVLDWIRSACA